MLGILNGGVVAGDVVVIRYEGPRGGPGMQEMLYPTSYLKSKGLGKACALDHRRALLRRHLGPLDRPCLAGSGRGRRDRPGRRRATASRSTSPAARSSCWSPTRSWRIAAPRWRPRARTPGSRRSRASATSRRRCAPMPPSPRAPRAARCAWCRDSCRRWRSAAAGRRVRVRLTCQSPISARDLRLRWRLSTTGYSTRRA